MLADRGEAARWHAHAYARGNWGGGHAEPSEAIKVVGARSDARRLNGAAAAAVIGGGSNSDGGGEERRRRGGGARDAGEG